MNNDSSFIALLICVDDVILASNDMHQIELVKNYLRDKFKIKDLCELKFFLALEITRSSIGINICKENIP